MKIESAYFIITCGLLLNLTSSYAQDESNNYILSEKNIDLGFVENDSYANDTLILTNPTSHPFYIDNIRTSCGCTVAEWPEESIPPLDTLAIPIQFKCKKNGIKEVKAAIWLSHLKKPINIHLAATCY